MLGYFADRWGIFGPLLPYIRLLDENEISIDARRESFDKVFKI
jgi:hypothetical protein